MNFSEQIYRELARIGHALSDPNRLKILNLLAQSERSVEDLSNMIGHSAPNTSNHLKVLQAAKLVQRRREGRRVFYSSMDAPTVKLWRSLRDMGLSSSPELREQMRSIADSETVSLETLPESLYQQIQAGKLTLLDLRPREEFAAGHLPLAQSLPAAELSERLHELDPQVKILAYCRGPFCSGAVESVARLRAHGFDVQRVFGGVVEWLAEGQALESINEPSVGPLASHIDQRVSDGDIL